MGFETMPFAEVDGARLFYEITGSGPPLVFVHGAGGNQLIWFQQVPSFARTFTSVSYDQRGWGRSIAPEDGVSGRAFVTDLSGLLDALGIDAAHLVAHSMGGWTALGLAHRHPERVRSLTLCGTTGGIETAEIRTAVRLGHEPEPDEDLPFTAAASLSARFVRERPDLAYLYTTIGGLNPPHPRLPMADHLRSINVLSAEQAAALRVPVQFVAGEESSAVPPAAIKLAQRLVPGSRFVLVPGTGHAVFYEQPGIFNRLVERFIAETSS
ncbi:MAG TPA: alpha/beta hydrolase [Dehalococcoidia bacterium]|nr:alpha/beta hydrolase [Dehalococcoidia bacterium]